MSSTPHFFLITSPGYTATKWLAWALQQHPKIYCNHSAGSDVLDRDYNLVELEALVDEKFQQRNDFPLDQFFSGLHPNEESLVRGNVHRYSWRSLAANRKKWKPQMSFVALNLIRHPILWVASGAKQMERMTLSVPFVRSQLQQHFRRNQKRYRSLRVPNEEFSSMAFCFMCFRMKQLVQEAHMLVDAPFPMEAFTSQRQTFASLLYQISGVQVCVGKIVHDRCLQSANTLRVFPIFR